MTTSTATEYLISYRVVDRVDNQGRDCEHCGDRSIVVNLYLPLGSDADRHVETVNAECCLACVLPLVDGTPYLEATHTVVAEVARSATDRPF